MTDFFRGEQNRHQRGARTGKTKQSKAKADSLRLCAHGVGRRPHARHVIGDALVRTYVRAQRFFNAGTQDFGLDFLIRRSAARMDSV